MLLGSLTVAAALVITPMASATSSKAKSSCTSGAGTKVKGALTCQGIAFYKGQQVTFISAGAPGGAFDQLARDLAPYMAKYLDTNINVEDISAADTIAGMDAVAAAPPNGLTLGEGNPPGVVLDALTGQPGINFDFSREAFIGTVPAGDNVFVASTTSPITNLKAMKSASTITMLGTGQGITDINMRVTQAIFGMHMQFITAYGSAAQVISGFDRGDGDMFMQPLSTVGPLLSGGIARAVLQSGKPAKGITYGKYVAGVPTFAEAAQKYPPKTKADRTMFTTLQDLNELSGQLVMAPSATPSAEVQALRAAFIWASKNANLKAVLLGQGNNPTGYITGPQSKATYLTIEKKADSIKAALIP
jgi:tripartite-type tricarboxylate transporter receptor subunit TctC